jgi:hypothetical protein
VKAARFRFSVGTLLIVVMWSAVVSWMNTRPGHPSPYVTWNSSRSFVHSLDWNYGWPLTCVTCRTDYRPEQLARGAVPVAWYPWNVVANVAIGVLLVAVLTWGSAFLLRHTHRPQLPILEKTDYT